MSASPRATTPYFAWLSIGIAAAVVPIAASNWPMRSVLVCAFSTERSSRAAFTLIWGETISLRHGESPDSGCVHVPPPRTAAINEPGPPDVG